MIILAKFLHKQVYFSHFSAIIITLLSPKEKSMTIDNDQEQQCKTQHDFSENWDSTPLEIHDDLDSKLKLIQNQLHFQIHDLCKFLLTNIETFYKLTTN